MASRARIEVEALSPYVCARDLFKQAKVLLDANENAFASETVLGVQLNRYPDPDCSGLRSSLAAYCGVGAEAVLVGNGSDEVISLATNAFAGKGDNVIAVQPGYPMYDVCAQAAGIEVRNVRLARGYGLDVEAVLETADERTKIVFVVSPNSVIGTPVAPEEVRSLARRFAGIVFVDEAYFEYCGKTAVSLVGELDNVIVSRTLSKAWGLASLRVGYCLSSVENIRAMRKIKLPYSVNGLSQALAERAVRLGKQRMLESVWQTVEERRKLAAKLARLGAFVYPGEANFVLAKLRPEIDALEVHRKLAMEGIVVRERTALVENSLRITIGTPAENALLLEKLSQIIAELGEMNGNKLTGILIASDVDGTIVQGDTILEFFREQGFLEEAEALNEIVPGSDVSVVLRKIASHKRLGEQDFLRIADSAEFFPGAQEFYAKMERMGAVIALLTATYEPIAKRIAERLGVKKPIIAATALEKRGGRVNGIAGSIMEGQEKERALLRACKENGFSLSDAVGIGDSQGDEAFLYRIRRKGGLCFRVSTPNFRKIEEKILERFCAEVK